MINEQTPNLQLPLPHAKNLLLQDVDRLRLALTQIDTLIHTQAQSALSMQQQQKKHMRKIRILALAGL